MKRSGALLPLALLGGFAVSSGQSLPTVAPQEAAASLPGPDTQPAAFRCEADDRLAYVCRMTDAAKAAYRQGHPPTRIPPMLPTLAASFATPLPGFEGKPAPYTCSLQGFDRSENLSYACVSPRETAAMKRAQKNPPVPVSQVPEQGPTLRVAEVVGGLVVLGTAAAASRSRGK